MKLKLYKVTIVPRGQQALCNDVTKTNRFLMTEPELLDKICGLLGGRI